MAFASSGTEPAQRCRELCPSMRVFLDVEDLASGSGLKEVDHSRYILVFAMPVYFQKINCVKEMTRAIVRHKPIPLLLPDLEVHGAFTPAFATFCGSRERYMPHVCVRGVGVCVYTRFVMARYASPSKILFLMPARERRVDALEPAAAEGRLKRGSLPARDEARLHVRGAVVLDVAGQVLHGGVRGECGHL